VRVCVFVFERERDGGREYVRVCVFVRERKRKERERVCVSGRKRM